MTNFDIIWLTRGQYALVSPEDYEWAVGSVWQHAGRNGVTGYAARSRYPRSPGYMHREIAARCFGTVDGLQVDHVNHDGLDNRRGNLRLATQSQNSANVAKTRKNKSGYVGVHRHTTEPKWVAQIGYGKKVYHLGLFETAEQAALVYNERSLAIRGDFAYLNEVKR